MKKINRKLKQHGQGRSSRLYSFDEDPECIRLNEKYFNELLFIVKREMETIYRCNIVLIHYLYDRTYITSEMYHNVLSVSVAELSAQLTVCFENMNDEDPATYLVFIIPHTKKTVASELMEAYFKTCEVGNNTYIYVPTDMIESLFFMKKKLIS